MIHGSLSTIRVNFIALNMLCCELTFCAFISTFVFARGVPVHANVVGSVSKACQKRVKRVSKRVKASEHIFSGQIIGVENRQFTNH